jgi:hypothetical protein
VEFFFEICGIVEQDLEVKKSYRLWWMLDEDVDFRIIRLDEDASEIKNYAVKKKTGLLTYLLSMM